MPECVHRVGVRDGLFLERYVDWADDAFVDSWGPPSTPALALRAAKKSVDLGIETDLATGQEIERIHFAGLFATDDRAIGMQAFVDKTKPEFTGN